MGSQSRIRFPIGFVGLAILISIVKAILVVRRTSPDSYAFSFFHLIWRDCFVIGVLLLLSFLSSIAKQKLFQHALNILSTLFLLIYIAHTLVLFAVATPLSVGQFIKFIPDWRYVLSVMDISKWAIIFLGITASFWQQSIPTKFHRHLWAVGSLLVLISCYKKDAAAFAFYDKYSLVAGPNLQWLSKSEKIYETRFVEAALKRYSKREKLQLPNDQPHIILVLSESLSSVDSLRLGGENDRLRRFDRFSQNGILFSNFYSNFPSSDGALVALFRGLPPLPFPGGNGNLFWAYKAKQDSVVEKFKDRGYKTRFLTNTDLRFQDQGAFLREMGFEVSEGVLEVERYKSAPRFVLDWPSDELLFDEALDQWKKLIDSKEPQFMTLQSITGHVPFQDPLRRGDTEENVWDFVDHELEDFYVGLDKLGFFKKGILIIMGDHRKHTDLSQKEFLAYGSSAKLRVPLVIIGKDVPSGITDPRPFQQADLFANLKNASSHRGPLSSEIVFSDRDSLVSGGPNGIVHVLVDGKNYKLNLQDLSLRWESPPPNEMEVGRKVHEMRAVSQYYRSLQGADCVLEFESENPSQESGIRSMLFSDNQINGRLNAESPRLLLRDKLDRFDFSHYLRRLTIFKNLSTDYALKFDGFFKIETSGYYSFEIGSDDGICFSIDQNLLIDANHGRAYETDHAEVYLNPGLHYFDLRYFQLSGNADLSVKWKKPTSTVFGDLQPGEVLLPREN